jgi:hypothetical protein
MPQAPQFELSNKMLAQLPLQSALFSPHWQVPAMHVPSQQPFRPEHSPPRLEQHESPSQRPLQHDDAVACVQYEPEGTHDRLPPAALDPPVEAPPAPTAPPVDEPAMPVPAEPPLDLPPVPDPPLARPPVLERPPVSLPPVPSPESSDSPPSWAASRLVPLSAPLHPIKPQSAAPQSARTLEDIE